MKALDEDGTCTHLQLGLIGCRAPSPPIRDELHHHILDIIMASPDPQELNTWDHQRQPEGEKVRLSGDPRPGELQQLWFVGVELRAVLSCCTS